MEPNSEKNHLDDLFARKLGKLERPPSADSFARLQQRMQGGQEQTRVVFWRSQTVQMAAAACLAAVLLFGWLYTNDRSTNPTGNSPTASVSKKKQPISEGAGEQPTIDRLEHEKTMPQLADNKSATEQTMAGRKPSARANSDHNQTPLEQRPLVATVPKTKGIQQAEEAAETMVSKPATTPVIAAVPQTAVASKPTAERVLIVTIQEPEALVAARQTANSVVNNMPVLAASPTKEGKASFWNQVKRLKQDDDVARQEGPTDESGLLSRAYKGIRQKLEKDKPAKQ